MRIFKIYIFFIIIIFILKINFSGKVIVWGCNCFGESGDGTITTTKNPTIISTFPVGVNITNIPTDGHGGQNTAAIDVQGNVYIWGKNQEGEIADGTTVDKYNPTLVSGLSGIKILKVSLGSYHVLAVDATGKAWCWGGNLDGE
jgi:alpha-tubulin suppressor-like RCC1 family protein